MKKNLLFIPMYNCEKQIIRVLKQIDRNALSFFDTILVVDNRSTDHGKEKVMEYCAKNKDLPIVLISNRENYGLGGSHKIAFNYAIENYFDYVVVMHGDDQGNIKDLIPHLESKEAYNYDSFLGSRFEKNSKLINYSKFRIFGNVIFNRFLSLCLGEKITDLGSGLNMYSVEYLKSRFYMPFIDTLSFNVYMLIYGVYSQSSFRFFDLTWREEDQVSNAKFLKQSMEIAKVAVAYLFNKKRLFFEMKNTEKEYAYDIVYEREKE